MYFICFVYKYFSIEPLLKLCNNIFFIPTLKKIILEIKEVVEIKEMVVVEIEPLWWKSKKWRSGGASRRWLPEN